MLSNFSAMLKRSPILRSCLVVVTYVAIRAAFDHFQHGDLSLELQQHLFVGAFTGLFLYFTLFRKEKAVKEG